jgi:hypothetical protein
MARNTPFVPRPRRGIRVRRERASALAAVGAEPVATGPEGPATPDDVATVHGWLQRLATDPAEAEELLVEVLRRSREPAPACLRAAPDVTRLQFLTIQSVLRLRGVI